MPISTSMRAFPPPPRRARPASRSARRSSTARRSSKLAGGRIAGTSVDDRAGCAVLVEAAEGILGLARRPTVHIVFSVQEEFNLRGALTAAQALAPDIAIQLDLLLATDTPDNGQPRGEVSLGGRPGIAMYSFHGRGTLNGTIPHPALVALFDQTAARTGMALQKSAHVGALTDSSYVQLVGRGSRPSMSAFRCAIRIRRWKSAIWGTLPRSPVLVDAIGAIGPGFSLDRDDFEQ